MMKTVILVYVSNLRIN